MIADLHVHTKFSVDSNVKMEEYCTWAIQNKIDAICFTDHVDFNKEDIGYGYYDVEGYFDAYHAVNIKYGNELKILSGMEIGEPHLYDKEFEELRKYPFDFIIGSVHWVKGMFPENKVRERYSLDEFMKLCMEETLKMVERGGFHSLGHIDFPKRYYGESYNWKKGCDEIFRLMVRKGIVLEINTSSLRKGLSETMPDEGVLQLYKDCGGEFVTIGSDAHKLDELGVNVAYAKNLIKKIGLHEVYFVQGERILVV